MGPNDEWPPSRAAIAQKKSEMIQDTPEDTVREPSQKQRRLRSYPLPSFNEAGENSPRKLDHARRRGRWHPGFNEAGENSPRKFGHKRTYTREDVWLQ